MSTQTPEQVTNITPLAAHRIQQFGAVAVDADKLHAVFAATSDDGLEAKTLESLFSDRAQTNLMAEQEQAQYVYFGNKERLEKFNQSVSRLEPPVSILNMFGVEADPQQLGEKVLFAEDKPVQVLNFMQWYDYALQKHQAGFEKDVKPSLLQRLTDRLVKASDDDIMPIDIPERFGVLYGLNKLHIYVADRPYAPGTEATTLHFSDGNELVEIDTLDLDAEAMEINFTHEMLHALSGKIDEPDGKHAGPINNNRGMYRIFGSGAAGLVMDEAIVAHLTDGLLFGNFENTDVNSPDRAHAYSYIGQRALLHVLCTRGEIQLSPRLFTQALMAEGPELERATNKLFTALDMAFPDIAIVQTLKAIDTVDELDIAQIAMDLAGASEAKQKSR